MARKFMSMTKDEQFEFLKKKGYPYFYQWLTKLSQDLQKEFWQYYTEPGRIKYLEDKFQGYKDADDITIRKQQEIIALTDPKGAIEFAQRVAEYKKGK